MPTPDEIASEEQKLYESPSLRDDLNDSEATPLLEWGQEQVRRLAREYPDDFESQCRYLRQLIKGINRFVGQREFQETRAGEDKYMKKIVMWLPKLGWDDVTEAQLYAALPDNKADMAANLDAILAVLTPPESGAESDAEAPSPDDAATGTDAADIASPSDAPTAPTMPTTSPDAVPSQEASPFAPPRHDDTADEASPSNTTGATSPDDAASSDDDSPDTPAQ